MLSAEQNPGRQRTFGGLLRQQRLAAGLTQEQLAERADLGVRSIQDLERGAARPLRRTAEALAHALELDGEALAEFRLAAAPAPRPRAASPQASGGDLPSPMQPAAPTRHIERGTGGPLLPTKLLAPAPRPRAVPRRRLLERLAAATRVPLTLVVAPAGFGKTTLLAQWASAPGPVRWAWVSLDTGDRDPARFWSYVVAALQGAWPSLGSQELTLAAFDASRPPATGAIPAQLIADLARLDQDLMLVLDDYHLAEEPAIDADLALLVERAPPRLHLVIGSRTDPSLPLARLRARGALLEVRADELRFTAEEASRFCRETMGLDLAAATVERLDARTEGWWVGLQLAALSLRNRPDPTAFVDAFAGSHRHVLDYLVEEVLAQQSPPRQAFLLQTAMLERLSGPLCDAVTGGHAGQAQLEQLERDNLFLVPLDDRREWYRYHQLFRDVLRHHLRLSSPALVPELHRRASTWCAEHGLREEAVEHALAAGDWERMAELLENWMEPLRLRGEYGTLARWLGALPESVRADHPRLSYQYGLALTRRGRAADVDHALRALETAERQARAASDAALLGAVARARLGLSIQRGALDEALDWGQQAAAEIPPNATQLRVEALATLGRTWVLHGEPVAAEPVLEEAERLLHPNMDAELHCLVLNAEAHLALARGQLRRAEARLQQVRQFAGAQPSLERAHAAVRLSEVYREWNRLDQAEAMLQEAQQLSASSAQAAYQFPLLNAAIGLRLARGDLLGGLALLDERERIGRAWGNAAVLREVAADRARVHLMQGDMAAVRRWTDQLEPRLEQLRYLEDDRVVEMLARAWIGCGQPARARELLATRREAAIAGGRGRHLIAIGALEALACHAHRDHRGAARALEQALEQAGPDGYVRTFLDEGPPMLALLREALGRDTCPAYVSSLLKAFTCHGTPPAGGLLTERERQVLQLLAGGCTTRQVAERLVIAEQTAKVHVGRILHKLGAHNRTQALNRARTLGLV